MADEKPAPDFRRTVNNYALIIGVLACVNFWIYWSQGGNLTLILGIVCLACLVGWLVVARMLLR